MQGLIDAGMEKTGLDIAAKLTQAAAGACSATIDAEAVSSMIGVTGLIASPNASGACDSTVVQVVTSPLPCASVRDTLLRGGRMEGDLAGVLLMRSGQDQTLLMSIATNSCVLIGFHSTFRI